MYVADHGEFGTHWPEVLALVYHASQCCDALEADGGVALVDATNHVVPLAPAAPRAKHDTEHFG